MKLLLENWRKYLTEDEEGLSKIISQYGEQIVDLWYTPGHRGQAISLIRPFYKDETIKKLSNEEWIEMNLESLKKLRIWVIHLPRLTSRQLDSFWTFAEADEIVKQLNEKPSITEGEELEFYIKDYKIIQEDFYDLQIPTIEVEFKNEEDYVFFSREQKFKFSDSITDAFDAAAETIAPGRFDKGGRYTTDSDRLNRHYKNR